MTSTGVRTAEHPESNGDCMTAVASLLVGAGFFSLWFWLLPGWLGFHVETTGAARWRWRAWWCWECTCLCWDTRNRRYAGCLPRSMRNTAGMCRGGCRACGHGRGQEKTWMEWGCETFQKKMPGQKVRDAERQERISFPVCRHTGRTWVPRR